MIPPKHLLVFRFSALGDVAMTVPVLRNLLVQHPGLRITMVSAGFAAPLFQGMERLQFYTADLRGRHKGVAGMYRLFNELKTQNEFDALADLHNVLRTKILRSFFRLAKMPVAVIDKGRKEKRELTRPMNKLLRPLKSTFQRYADVLAQVNLPVELDVATGLSPKPDVPGKLAALRADGYSLIGIAPFAAYVEKTYPASQMKEVLQLLATNKKIAVFLFGGKENKKALDEWTTLFSNIFNCAGTGLEGELAIIANLDVMVSMDSANMHIASIFGVPVVSVWGGTHPYLGFMGWGQSLQNAVQIDLPCRPSSVYGNKPCTNNCACMKGISPLLIQGKVLEVLKAVAQ